VPTPETDDRSAPALGTAVKEVAERASAIFRLELELATIELRRKARALGFGIGFAVGAAVVLVFMIGFAFATIAAALTTVMSTWAALLVVTGSLLVTAGALGFLALTRIKKGTPPFPEQAISEAKLTTEALKSDGR
jgi:protein-S-isoprenylcysteine O-methyltransferase Ste14